MKPTWADIEFEKITTLKPRLSEYINRIAKNRKALAIMSGGVPKAMLVSFEDYRELLEELESLEATVELLSDPKMLEGFKRGLQDLEAGRLHSYDEVFGR